MQVTAAAINNWGGVVGTLTCTDEWFFTDDHDFLWLPSQRYAMYEGMNLLPHTSIGDAVDINDDGHVIGRFLYHWNLNDLSLSQYLPIPTALSATAINNQSPFWITGMAAVGTSKDAYRAEFGVFVPGYINSPIGSAIPHDISDTGTVAAAAKPYSQCDPVQPGCEHRAVEWPFGQLDGELLPNVADPTLERDTTYGTNSIEQFVGRAWDRTDPDRERATFWEHADAIGEILPLLPGVTDDRMLANAIADPFIDGHLQVVGKSVNELSAVLWIRDTQQTWSAHDLTSLVVCGELPGNLHEAVDINNAGWIVAHGGNVNNPESHVLISMDNCPADVNLDGVVDVSDLLALLAAWGPQDPCHPADVTRSGEVDVSDLLGLLAQWGTCPGFPNHGPPAQSIQQIMDDAGLTMDDFWDYVSVITGDDARARANWDCWFNNYISGCQHCSRCPGPDPFVN